MTKSVTNSGVEDVLSSVKRLVSEDVREESEFIFIPTAAARKPGRLVLTESLRVGPDATAPLKLVPEPEAQRETAEVTVGASETAAAPMRLQPSDIVPPQATPANSPQTADEKESGKKDLAGSLSAKIEALEAAIARTEDQWEPDGESDDAYSGTPTKAVDWSDESEEEAAEEASDAPVMFTRRSDNTTPSLPKLDEDALSEMVAQIVRRELQGALGEGITRNIRKMVRREISKALAEQEQS